MSFEAIDLVVDLDLRASEGKSVLVALANRADGASWQCFPGHARIARDTGLSVSSVARHLKRLEADGYITRTARWTHLGDRDSDLYTLNMDYLRMKGLASGKRSVRSP